jgi:hypothetical protein
MAANRFFPRPGPSSRRIARVAAALAAGAGLAAFAALALREARRRPPGVAFHEPPPPPLAFLSDDLRNYDLASFPPSVLRGGKLIAQRRCLECHRINGDGNSRGVALRGLAGKRPKPWLIAHFKNPKAFSAESRMPSYARLPERDLSAMADYLLAIP